MHDARVNICLPASEAAWFSSIPPPRAREWAGNSSNYDVITVLDRRRLWVLIFNCVTLRKSLNSAKPQCPHVKWAFPTSWSSVLLDYLLDQEGGSPSYTPPHTSVSAVHGHLCLEGMNILTLTMSTIVRHNARCPPCGSLHCLSLLLVQQGW